MSSGNVSHQNRPIHASLISGATTIAAATTEAFKFLDSGGNAVTLSRVFIQNNSNYDVNVRLGSSTTGDLTSNSGTADFMVPSGTSIPVPISETAVRYLLVRNLDATNAINYNPAGTKDIFIFGWVRG